MKKKGVIEKERKKEIRRQKRENEQRMMLRKKSREKSGAGCNFTVTAPNQRI